MEENLRVEKNEEEILNLFWKGIFVSMLREFYEGKPEFSKKKILRSRDGTV